MQCLRMSHLPWGNPPNEPSSPVKLGAGLASVAPVKVLTDCGGVVGLVESATIEVQVSLRSSRIQHGLTPVTAPARNTWQVLSE